MGTCLTSMYNFDCSDRGRCMGQEFVWGWSLHAPVPRDGMAVGRGEIFKLASQLSVVGMGMNMMQFDTLHAPGLGASSRNSCPGEHGGHVLSSCSSALTDQYNMHGIERLEQKLQPLIHGSVHAHAEGGMYAFAHGPPCAGHVVCFFQRNGITGYRYCL